MLLTLELLTLAWAIFILQRRPKRSKKLRQQNPHTRKGVASADWQAHTAGKAHFWGTQKIRKFRAHNFRFLDLGMILTEVSTRLRSGAMLESAWEKTLAHTGLLGLPLKHTPEIAHTSDDQPKMQAKSMQIRNFSASFHAHPPVLDADGVPQALRAIWSANRFQRIRFGIPRHVIEALPATFAVCRLGYRAGAPMAQVLDSCARGVTEASEARAARRTALAGPVASARMLAALPVIGIFFGLALGINVPDFLVHSFLGNICLSIGIIFELAGICYVRFLIAQALTGEH
ncbi:type II secretion system F family protein [Arcanobacterium hippocoleae]|uniref:type II secretion system F family protein n=1 Tax=Arcanobacterium hippocoleae TaxID=149017 RepID=UPI003342711D